MLNWTERIIRLRKECPEIGWGTYKVLSTGDSSVLAIRYDWRNNAIITVHNLNEKQKSFTIDAGGPGGDRLTNLVGDEHSYAGPNEKHKIVLAGYGYCWYRVGGLGHILRREKY